MEEFTVRYKNLVDLLDQSVAKHGEKPLFFFPDDSKEISYDEFGKIVNQTANIISKRGIVKGDRVAVMLPNTMEFPVAWMAIGKRGAIMVPINTSYQSADLEYVLNDSGAKMIFIHEDYYHILEKVLAKCKDLKYIVVVGEKHLKDGIDYYRELEDAEMSFEAPDIELEDLMNIQYTSGTTGFPKGCMLTHKYWLQLGKAASEKMEITEEDRNLCAQPFYYMDAQWNTVLCMMHGIALVVMKRFSSSRHWEICKKYGVTFFYCLGTMPLYLLNMPEDPENEKQHKLRAVYCSGIYPQLHKTFEDRWNVPWREAFGMTETGVDLIVSLDDTGRVGSGATGKPIPSKEARIVDENDNELPPGEVGELVVRGEPMMLGYWNKPEATAKIMRNGWLHTGDLAYKDEHGYFYWVGRKKDMVRRGGENISSAEVESVLSEHPKIKLAAVVPVPDPLREEEVKAYIVLSEGETAETVSPEEIVEFARQNLSLFKAPRYIEYRDELPKTPSERVEKYKLVSEKDDLRKDSYDVVDEVWR